MMRLEILLNPFQSKRNKKGDKLIIEGQYVNKTYFVVDGCLRSYVYDIKVRTYPSICIKRSLDQRLHGYL